MVVHARSDHTYHIIANVLIKGCYCAVHALGSCLFEVEARAKLDIERAVFAASSNCPFLTVRNVVDLGRGGFSKNNGSVKPGLQMQVHVLHTVPFPAGNWMHFNNIPTISYPALQHKCHGLQYH